MTAPEEALLDALQAMPTDGIGPRVIGAHVEGPFLSPRQTGVHDPRGLLARRTSRCCAGCSTRRR